MATTGDRLLPDTFTVIWNLERFEACRLWNCKTSVLLHICCKCYWFSAKADQNSKKSAVLVESTQKYVAEGNSFMFDTWIEHHPYLARLLWAMDTDFPHLSLIAVLALLVFRSTSFARNQWTASWFPICLSRVSKRVERRFKAWGQLLEKCFQGD